MNGYNFTQQVRQSLMYAREEAIALNHEYVGTEHLLLGLARQTEGVSAAVLQNASLAEADIRDRVMAIVRRGPAPPDSPPGAIRSVTDVLGLTRKGGGPDRPYTSRAKKSLELAMSEARNLNHSYVGTEHLLLGVLAETKGIAAQVLLGLGLTTDGVRAEVVRLVGTEVPPLSRAAMPRPAERRTNITIVIDRGDGRLDAMKFTTSRDAMRFLSDLEA